LPPVGLLMDKFSYSGIGEVWTMALFPVLIREHVKSWAVASRHQ
jgi:hypothetical protein